MQTFPPAHVAPSAREDQVEVELAGLHCWQGSTGLSSFAAMKTPSMKHRARQAPEEQTSLAAHVVPSGLADQLVVERAGSHCSQALSGLTANGWRSTPSMKHWALQAPAPQTLLAAHAVPSARAVHAVLEAAGAQ